MLSTDTIFGSRVNVLKKQSFDLGLTLLSAPIWITALVVCYLAILISEGRPVFYRSRRRAFPNDSLNIIKFRTMIRNADKIANRDSIPATETCFLNIPPSSDLYTSVGSVIERLCLTEVPQFLHVILGKMSIIGNRPLPENVVNSLCERYPYAADRFLSKAGLTGPVQLIGRDNLSDEDRLKIEIDYALICTFAYSAKMDLALLLHTVFVAAGIIKPHTLHSLRILMSKYTQGHVETCSSFGERRSFLRFPVNLQASVQLNDGSLVSIVVRDIGYNGAMALLKQDSGRAFEIQESIDLIVPLGDRLISLKSRIILCVMASQDNTLHLEFTPDDGHGVKIASIIAFMNKT